MVKGLTSQIISVLGRLNIFGDFWALYFLYWKLFVHVLCFTYWYLSALIFSVSFFFPFFFCCIISFIIYFISSCEIKAQELYSSLQKKGRMKCILNTLRNLLAKIEMHATSLSQLFPSLSQMYQTPFHPKLL